MKNIESRIEKAEKTVNPKPGIEILPPLITFGSVSPERIEQETEKARRFMQEHPGRIAAPIVLSENE